MAALPATVPIMLSSERRLGAGSVISGCPFAGLLSQRMTGLAMWPATSGNRQSDQRHEFEAADGGTPAPFRLEIAPSWLRSSQYHRYQARSELRNQNDTGNQ